MYLSEFLHKKELYRRFLLVLQLVSRESFVYGVDTKNRPVWYRES